MTNEEMEQHGLYASRYSIEGRRETVEYRGAGAWAVVDGASNLNHDGQWEDEPRPSSRDDAFLSRCRFPLGQALRMLIAL